MKKLACLLPLLSIPVLAGCAHQIPPSTVGILFDGGTGISDKILTPKVVWTKPYQRLITYTTATKQATFVRAAKEGDKEGDDSVKATTSEGAVLPIDVTVAYHVEPGNVVKAFETFGTEDLDDIQANYIRWLTIYAVNVVSGRHSIFGILSKDRKNISKDVQEVLAPELAALGITLDNVYVGETYPNKEIQDKVQESINARNDLAKAEIDRQKALIEARTILTNAERAAAQNKLLANQGDKAVMLKKIHLRQLAVQKWNGRTPLVGDGTIPFSNGMKPN